MRDTQDKLFQSIWSKYSRKLAFITLIFLASCFWGGIFQRHHNPFPPDPPSYSWFHYFSHNINQSILSIGLGILTYGIGSLILLALNGTLIGIVLAVMVQNDMTLEIFKSFLPHGVFEILAILLSCLYPYMVWGFIFQSIKKRGIDFNLLKREIIPVPIIITILLIIAGCMESVFTL
ncbi:TPA: stage II sporulation protein M [Bacillus toyonensis]|uniref:stage II sporulation protein M n=1 Tax=Bacillus cereus group TaxID=86661 RepID=UPI00321B96FE|nr:stage II sporulation protein M [Bacillus toyonensis]